MTTAMTSITGHPVFTGRKTRYRLSFPKSNYDHRPRHIVRTQPGRTYRRHRSQRDRKIHLTANAFQNTVRTVRNTNPLRKNPGQLQQYPTGTGNKPRAHRTITFPQPYRCRNHCPGKATLYQLDRQSHCRRYPQSQGSHYPAPSRNSTAQKVLYIERRTVSKSYDSPGYRSGHLTGYPRRTHYTPRCVPQDLYTEAPPRPGSHNTKEYIVLFTRN